MSRPTRLPGDQAEGFGRARKPFSHVLWVQGVYYFVTGVWPLVSIDTFQMVTGPKNDLWLVRTVAVLIVAISLALLTAATRQHCTMETAVLALGSIAALTGVDVIYVSLRVIPPIYLLDAAAELVLAGWWAAAYSVSARRV